MKSVAVIVFIKLIFLAVERKLAMSDAVGITSDRSAEVSLSFVINIAVDIIVTENDIIVIAFNIWCPQRHNTSAVVCNLHGQITIFQSVKRYFLAVHFSIKIIGIHKINLFFLCTTD